MGVLAELGGGDDERLVLDRPGAQENLPVRLAGHAREVRGHGDDPRALDRLDPVQLGEAQVVADGQPDRGAVGQLGDDDLVAGLLGVGLEVLALGDLDVEQVDLAVDGLQLTVGADVRGRVRVLVAALPALDERAGDQVDAQPAARPAPTRRWGATRRRRGARVVVVVAAHVRPLGQHEAGARSAAAARTSSSARARFRSLCSLESSCTAATRTVLLPMRG